MATEPYKLDGQWWIDHDPDDEEYIYGDLTTKLADVGGTATSVVALVPDGITILDPATVSGVIAKVKITGHDDTPSLINFVTFRVSYTNAAGTGRFDKTVYLKKLEG